MGRNGFIWGANWGLLSGAAYSTAQMCSSGLPPCLKSDLLPYMVSALEESLLLALALQPNEVDRLFKMADIGGAVSKLFRVAREARINAI